MSEMTLCTHYTTFTMRFRIPGKSIHVRIFEPVQTTDEQYYIYDTGLDYGDGTIDSVAVGGSFATLKRLANEADEKSLQKRQDTVETTVA